MTLALRDSISVIASCSAAVSNGTKFDWSMPCGIILPFSSTASFVPLTASGTAVTSCATKPSLVSSSPIKEVVKTEGGDYPVYGENVGDPQNVGRIGETLVHELGHEFYGHRARRGDEAQWVEESEGGRRKYTPPERTLYQKADRFLKGWLPNLGQKYAQRPNLLLQAQDTERSKREIRYNKRMQKGDYHPQYSDLPFYDLEQSVTLAPETLAKIGKAVAGPDKAKEFRTAFRSARKRGDAVFTWDGRKYTTELKK